MNCIRFRKPLIKTLAGFLSLAGLLIFVYSCEKAIDPEAKVVESEVRTSELVYYPEKHFSMTFDIVPGDDAASFTIKWIHPDSLGSSGPFTLRFTDDVQLEYEVSVNGGESRRFQYTILADTIDSIRYDYRNRYTGRYSCDVTTIYMDSVSHYRDTLTVVKNASYTMVNILTRSDVLHNYPGNTMHYQNSNGFYTSPDGSFYGYHSGVLFTPDSIDYTASGPLGYYYTNRYTGVKLD